MEDWSNHQSSKQTYYNFNLEEKKPLTVKLSHYCNYSLFDGCRFMLPGEGRWMPGDNWHAQVDFTGNAWYSSELYMVMLAGFIYTHRLELTSKQPPHK